MFRFHLPEVQHLEFIHQVGGVVKRGPGRTGDDFLAFQRDSNGKIVSVLYGEAKCTTGHDTDMITEAHEKAGESVIVDLLRVIEILRDYKNPSSGEWIDAIRKAWFDNSQFERYDLVSYVYPTGCATR